MKIKSYEKIIEVFGLKNPRIVGNELRSLCPFHRETKGSFFLNLDKGVWFCFGCGKGGSVLRLLREKGLKEDKISGFFDMKEIAKRDKLLEDLYRKRECEDVKSPKVRFFALPELKGEDKDSVAVKYLERRKLGGINLNDVRYDKLSNCLVFAIRNLKGEIIGVTYRGVYSDRRYVYPSGLKSELGGLYGLYRALLVKDSKIPVIVEGELDCENVWRAGNSSIALLGWRVTDRQIQNLLNFSRLVLALDNDFSGFKGRNRLVSKLKEVMMNLYLVRLIYKDPAQHTVEEWKQVYLKKEDVISRIISEKLNS